MSATIGVYDAMVECLQVLADVAPSDRRKVIDALHHLAWGSDGAKVLCAAQSAPTPGCCYEDCSDDAKVVIGAQAFCHYHAADGLLTGMSPGDRVQLVSLHVTSNEIADCEAQP